MVLIAAVLVKEIVTCGAVCLVDFKDFVLQVQTNIDEIADEGQILEQDVNLRVI